jgi:hypothetical protein
LRIPNSQRIFYLYEGLRRSMSIEELFNLTFFDPWYLNNFRQIVDMEAKIKEAGFHGLSGDFLKQVKQYGYADRQLAFLTGTSENDIRELREKEKIKPAYKLVDTCAAEFEAFTPYYYSTYERPLIQLGEGEVFDDEPDTAPAGVVQYGGETLDRVLDSGPSFHAFRTSPDMESDRPGVEAPGALENVPGHGACGVPVCLGQGPRTDVWRVIGGANPEFSGHPAGYGRVLRRGPAGFSGLEPFDGIQPVRGGLLECFPRRLELKMTGYGPNDVGHAALSVKNAR